MPINLTTGQRAAISEGFSDLHNLFAKPIFYYKEEQQTVITQSPDHNYFFSNAPQSTTTTKTTVSGIFSGRIYWSKQSLEGVKGNDYGKALLPDGTVKVIVDESGKSVMKSSEKFKYNDTIFELLPEPDVHGLLEKNFFTFYLKPTV